MICHAEKPNEYWKQGTMIGQGWVPQEDATVWSHKTRVELVLANCKKRYASAYIEEFRLSEKHSDI